MLAERIRSLRKERGMSLEALAEAVGVSRQTIFRYETGAITNIPSEKVEAMAKALGTTPARLMGWEDESDFSTFNSIKAEPFSAVATKSLPVLGNVACGEPVYAEEEHEHYAVTTDHINADFCLRATGDSMVNARIFDGDILFIHRCDIVEDGEIAVVLIEDEATVKRLHRRNGEIWLMPENENYSPIDGREAEIVGIVRAVIREY